MDKDGTKSGYDIDLLKAITKNKYPCHSFWWSWNFRSPCGWYRLGKASAVLAASIFHYGKYSIKDAKEYLNSKNVSVRFKMFKEFEHLIKTIRERKKFKS